MSTLPKASAGSRRLLSLVAAVVVAAVVAVVLVVSGAGRANGPTAPPILHLASVAGGSPGRSVVPAAGAPDQGGAAGGSPSGSGWALDATLPGGPSSGRVHLLAAGAATRVFVSALARSLGMSGVPQHLSGGWYLVSGTTELSVSELAGRHWTYSNHGCIAGPVFDPQTGTACAVATSVPPIAPAPGASGAPGSNGFNPPPTASSPVPENLARGLARPVLAAVGVNPDAAQVETAGGQRSVVVSPQVAGSTVLGLQTQVSVDEHGQIVDASGWLATPTAGTTYPLIGARQAYDQLRQQPIEMGMEPCRFVAGKPGCAPIPDRVVTGAKLGLSQAYSTDRAILLVPAWLFQVRGEPTPVAVVAVEAAFLGVPQQPFAGSAATTGSQPGRIGGGSGTNTGTGNTGAPTQLKPSGPTTGPATKPAQ